MVRILEKLGHTVVCPEGPACCGQPAFNTGYWDESRAVAIKVLESLKDAEVVVIASGSCGAMLKVFYPELLRARSMKQWPATSPRGATNSPRSSSTNSASRIWAPGSRTRSPSTTAATACASCRNKRPPRELLARIQGLELIEMGEAETCCGFGGTFAAKFPMISTAMGEVKCASALDTKAEYIVSCDSSCLMHLQGLIDRQRQPLKTIHLAELLCSHQRARRPVQARRPPPHRRPAPPPDHPDGDGQIRNRARPAQSGLSGLGRGAAVGGGDEVGSHRPP